MRRRAFTLIEMIGCSPDRADAFVLMIHGLVTKSPRVRVGAAA